MPKHNERFALGVDLGGTKIEAVVVKSVDGKNIETLSRQRIPTERQRGYEAIIEVVTELIHNTTNESGLDLKIVPIGLGMPGSITRATGLVKNSNTTCLNGRPFREDLQNRLNKKIFFENDANCFALAEAKMGAAADCKEGIVFGVILGTGVGGGIVCDGKIWTGSQNIAGEWGHHVLYPDTRPCYCGKKGCVETYISGPAVEAEYKKSSGKIKSLSEISVGLDHDGIAKEVIESFLNSFGLAISNVINILDPSVVVLGGGVSNLSCLYDKGIDKIKQYVFNDELLTPIRKNSLGDSAGVYGAALLALDDSILS